MVVDQSINFYLYSFSKRCPRALAQINREIENKRPNRALRASKVRQWPGKTPCGKKPRADRDSRAVVSYSFTKGHISILVALNIIITYCKYIFLGVLLQFTNTLWIENMIAYSLFIFWCSLYVMNTKKGMISINNDIVKFGLKQQNVPQTPHVKSYCENRCR